MLVKIQFLLNIYSYLNGIREAVDFKDSFFVLYFYTIDILNVKYNVLVTTNKNMYNLIIIKNIVIIQIRFNLNI